MTIGASSEASESERVPTPSLLLAQLDEAIRLLRIGDRKALIGKLDQLSMLARRLFQNSPRATPPDNGSIDPNLDEEYRRSIVRYLDRLAAGASDWNHHQLFVRLRFLDQSLTTYICRDNFRHAFGAESDEDL